MKMQFRRRGRICTAGKARSGNISNIVEKLIGKGTIRFPGKTIFKVGGRGGKAKNRGTFFKWFKGESEKRGFIRTAILGSSVFKILISGVISRGQRGKREGFTRGKG